jgi:signal transduction histidine kinase
MTFSGIRYRIPDIYVVLVSAVCAIPLLLNLFGIDLGNVIEQLSPVKVIEMSRIEEQAGYRDLLTGKYAHTIFVSISVTVALLTFILALVDYNIRREAGTLIIAMAFFCSGLLETFHLLVSTRVIPMYVNSYYLTSYTWFYCRLFLASIISLGILFYLLPGKRSTAAAMKTVEKRFGHFLIFVAVVFAMLTFATILFLLLSSNVSASAYPYRNIARNFELIPLAVYLFAALYLLPKYCERLPTVFSKSIMLSMIPAVAAQLYMTFGSLELYDNSFNISHFLHAATYFIPFAGLCLNYIEAHRKEKTANELLVQSEKLALTGRMTRMLAHEVRNPLTNINLSAEQLHSGFLSADESGRRYIEIIERNTKRINDLISEMLNVSRPSELELKEHTIYSLVDDALARAKDRIELNQIRIEKIYSDNIHSLMLDAEKICTAFLNIIINAVEAMEQGKGVLKIYISVFRDFCEVIFEDNGKGISHDLLLKIFEPFYTGKTSGTGLGLPAAKNIIESHGGVIEVESLEGKGSRFIIHLRVG